MKFHTSIPSLFALGMATSACLLPEEMIHQGPSRVSDSTRSRRGIGRRLGFGFQNFPIGSGDRFNSGSIVPKGLGTEDRNLESILNVGEVQTGLQGLAKAFSDVKLFTAPHATQENRRVYGATIGEPRVFIQSGIHARERGGPDNVLYFISDLLAASQKGTGLTYGKQTYTNEQVKTALSAGIAIIPLTNPDGVEYDQKTDSCWRKNRNPKSDTSSDGSGIGVDLNRNFDFTWDYKRLFNENRGEFFGAASDNSTSEVFHGTAPLSEPETRNIAWVMEQHKQLSWFLDLHSFTGDILYSWGDDDSQITDPRQNFMNKTYDAKRGFTGRDPPDSQYREYIEAKDLSDEQSLSKRMSEAMNNAGSISYTAKPSVGLYPAAGTSTDQALGQYYSHKCGANRIHGLAVEFGKETEHPTCPFYPDKSRYHESMRQVAAGLMELLLNAAGDAGNRKQYQCSMGTFSLPSAPRAALGQHRHGTVM